METAGDRVRVADGHNVPIQAVTGDRTTMWCHDGWKARGHRFIDCKRRAFGKGRQHKYIGRLIERVKGGKGHVAKEADILRQPAEQPPNLVVDAADDNEF